MTDKEQLKTIQNDIKNIDKCIEMSIDEDAIKYLKSIQKNMRKQEIEIVKKMAIEKALKNQKMKAYQIDVYKVNTGEKINTFIVKFRGIEQVHNYMENKIHHYKEPYFNLSYDVTVYNEEKQHE